MVDYDANERDRSQRRFRYPLTQRCLCLVPLLAAGAALALLKFSSLPGADAALRARVWFDERRGLGIGVLVVFALVTFWFFWISVRAWMTYIVVSPSSIKLHVVAHGRERVSWEHMMEVEYKSRLLGHTIILHGSDSSSVHFRSSIKGYDDLIAYIHQHATSDGQAQLEALLSEEDDEELEEGEEESGADAEAQKPQAAVQDAETEPKDEESEG